ncbi:MAG: hypothetical protein Q7J64_03840, partial [Elusimicrobiota bacterium]|nr:hypothetical protein [Elusimicrobiota bacterium]
MKRPLASALAFLIVALSPGAPAYQAFAQSVGKTGTTAGSSSDAATSVNTGVSGGVSAPLTMPTPSLGLNGALSLSPAPTLNPGINPALAAPAAVDGQAVAVVPVAAVAGAALLPPAQPQAQGGSAASKQVHALSATAKPVLEGIQKGDASHALNGVYEQGAKRGDLGAVAAGANAAAPPSGLKKPSPSAGQKDQSEVVPAAAAPAAKPGLIQRIRSTFDLSEFNKSEKSYILGQAVFLLAISVYLASLPLLVSALTGDAAMTGVARMVHYWVFGGASLFAGAVVSKTPMRRLLVGAAGGRALLFGSIGALALFGGMPWAAFLVLIGVNSLIVAHNHLVDIDTGGAAKIFKGKDQKSTDQKIEKAGYVYDFIYYGMMLVVPAMIGLPMDWIDAKYGAGIGAGAGFAVFAILMGVVSYIYATRVVTVGDMVETPWP